jgi:hypothetical protein
MKRLVVIAALGAGALGGAEPASAPTLVRDAATGVSQYLVALPHMAYGGGFRTKVVIRNTSSTAADVTLNYYGAGGSPLLVPFGGVGADHTSVTVPPNGVRYVEPDWQGQESGGWAGLVYTNSGVKIQGIFMWHNPADPADKYTEAAAPVISQAPVACIIPLPSASSTMTMPYDETEGRFSGYGFANTTSAAVTMSLTFYDQDGQTVGQYNQLLAGFEHVQLLLSEKVRSAANSKGTMQITGQGIVPLGFRFTPYYTFTTWMP